MLTIDPHSMEVASQRFWGDYAVTWMYDLHYTLLLEENGQTAIGNRQSAIGIVGLVMMLSLLSGIYLWWPSRKRWPSALQPMVRSGRVRATYDLHALGGIYSVVLLSILAITGAAPALPNTTSLLLGGPARHNPASKLLSTAQDSSAMLDLDVAVRQAKERFPNAELRWIETPGAGGKPIALRMYSPGEPIRRFPYTRVWVHPQHPMVLASYTPESNSAADSVR